MANSRSPARVPVAKKFFWHPTPIMHLKCGPDGRNLATKVVQGKLPRPKFIDFVKEGCKKHRCSNLLNVLVSCCIFVFKMTPLVLQIEVSKASPWEIREALEGFFACGNVFVFKVDPVIAQMEVNRASSWKILATFEGFFVCGNT